MCSFLELGHENVIFYCCVNNFKLLTLIQYCYILWWLHFNFSISYIFFLSSYTFRVFRCPYFLYRIAASGLFFYIIFNSEKTKQKNKEFNFTVFRVWFFDNFSSLILIRISIELQFIDWCTLFDLFFRKSGPSRREVRKNLSPGRYPVQKIWTPKNGVFTSGKT